MIIRIAKYLKSKKVIAMGLLTLALVALLAVSNTYAYDGSLLAAAMTPADFIEVVGDWLAGILGIILIAVEGVADLFWNSTAGEFTLVGMLMLFGLGMSFLTFGISFLLGFLKKG